MRFLALGFVALVILPAAAGAQQLTKAATKGPTLQAASIGFHASPAKADASTSRTAAPVIRPHAGQDVALMAVGVGAMIVGALVGDTAGTIIIIGGAGMALFGLYHYLE
jgi:hypothetical protein